MSKSASCFAILLLGLSTGVVNADVSANIGWVSDYLYRGIPQSESSFSAGLDYTKSGFNAGVWLADVGVGEEVDVYFSYGSDLTEKISYEVGATLYEYTDNFDDRYKELNASLAYQYLNLDVALGRYENFSGPTLDYAFYALTAERNQFYAMVGFFDQDFSGEYYEAGYKDEIYGFDVSLSVVHSTEKLIGEKDTSVVFGLGKTLTLFSE